MSFIVTSNNPPPNIEQIRAIHGAQLARLDTQHAEEQKELAQAAEAGLKTIVDSTDATITALELQNKCLIAEVATLKSAIKRLTD
jgi:hypothetical protein